MDVVRVYEAANNFLFSPEFRSNMKKLLTVLFALGCIWQSNATHVVGGEIMSSSLSDGQMATTLIGQGIDEAPFGRMHRLLT